jgi:hypothetical protein
MRCHFSKKKVKKMWIITLLMKELTTSLDFSVQLKKKRFRFVENYVHRLLFAFCQLYNIQNPVLFLQCISIYHKIRWISPDPYTRATRGVVQCARKCGSNFYTKCHKMALLKSQICSILQHSILDFFKRIC